MKRVVSTIVILTIFALLSSCKKDSGISKTTEEETTATISEQGLEALKSRDINTAKNTYCNALEGYSAMTVGTAKSGGGSPPSEICFGCAMSTFFSIWESEQVRNILEAFGERSLNVQVDIFDDNGLFHKAALRRQGATNSDGSPICFNELPFMGSSTCGTLITGTSYYRKGIKPQINQLVTGLICNLKSNGVNLVSIRSNLSDLASKLKEIDIILEPALSDSAFSFTIPKELFRTARDHTISVDDLNLFSAGLNMLILGLSSAASYDAGIDPDKICQAGKLDKDITLEDLNGSGITVSGVTVDSVPMLALLDSAKVNSLGTVYHNAVQRALTGLTGVKDHGSDVQWADFIKGLTRKIFKSKRGIFPSGTSTIDKAILTFTDFSNIESGMARVNTLSTRAQVNMSAFFVSPPDAVKAADASGSYPFVLENRCRMYGSCDRFPYAGVEIFWNEFIRGFAVR